MAAGPGPGALKIILLVLACLEASPDSEPSAASEKAAQAQRALGPLPRRFQWGFETTDTAGRELFAQRDVPIFLGDRATQPDWLQEFGARADPDRRDRFPREPMAVFSSRGPHQGRRALLIQSRGDCALVHLSRALPALGGASLRLSGQVRLQGLRQVELRLGVRFLGERLAPTDRRLASPALRGDHDWEKVEVSGQVPDLAEGIDVELHLEGSYRDGEVQAWVDDLALDLLPGLRVDWGQGGLLLFGEDAPRLAFDLEARGLSPGGYQVEALLTRLSPDPGPGVAEPLRYAGRRHVARPESGLPAPLRFRGDLRQMFPQDRLAGGLLRLTLRVVGLAREGGEGDAPIAERTETIGILPTAAEPEAARGVRLGWALRQSEIDRGDLALLGALPSGFPLSELLWDLAAEPFATEPPPFPSTERLAGARSGLTWRGRVGPAFLERSDALRLFREWAPLARSWAVAGGDGDHETAPALDKVHQASVLLALGSSGPGPRPPWASFSVLEVGSARAGTAEPSAPGQPGPADWALADAPRLAGQRDEFLALAALLLDLAQAGHRRIFIRGAADLLGEPAPDGRRAPRLAAFAWAGLGRILGAGIIEKAHDWDPRGRFLSLSLGGEEALITMSRGAEPLHLRRWTGLPLRGQDLFGQPVLAPFDASSLETVITARADPIVYRGLQPGLMGTVESLAQTGPGLRPVPGPQDLSFRLQNKTRGPIRVRLSLGLPAGFRAEGEGVSAGAGPGEEALFGLRVELPPDPPGGRATARVLLEVESGGRAFRLRREMELTIRSDLVRLSGEKLDPVERSLVFTVESLATRPLLLQVYCRIPLGAGRELLESWDERLPAGSRRTLSMPLEAPPEILEGREVRIGVEARGRSERILERYRLQRSREKLVLTRD